MDYSDYSNAKGEGVNWNTFNGDVAIEDIVKGNS